MVDGEIVGRPGVRAQPTPQLPREEAERCPGTSRLQGILQYAAADVRVLASRLS
jgi:hypothetical protein